MLVRVCLRLLCVVSVLGLFTGPVAAETLGRFMGGSVVVSSDGNFQPSSQSQWIDKANEMHAEFDHKVYFSEIDKEVRTAVCFVDVYRHPTNSKDEYSRILSKYTGESSVYKAEMNALRKWQASSGSAPVKSYEDNFFQNTRRKFIARKYTISNGKQTELEQVRLTLWSFAPVNNYFTAIHRSCTFAGRDDVDEALSSLYDIENSLSIEILE